MENIFTQQTRPDQLPGKKILITGASGFIGSHLCRVLIKRGCEVHAVSRKERDTDCVEMRWWQVDLTDSQEVENLFFRLKPDFVYHLASFVAGSRDLSLVIPMMNNNFITSVNILNAASKIGCQRLFLIGSMEEPASGNPEATPSSPYAAAKWASSAYGRMYHALYQVPVVILRLFMVYGPDQQDLKKLIPYVITCLLRDEPPMLSGGQRMVDWIFVEDVVAALVMASQAKDIEGKTIDIGSGELISVKTIVESLFRMVNPKILPHFGTLADRQLEQTRVAEIELSKSLLGWHPTTSMEEGLELTVKWYRQRFKDAAIEKPESAQNMMRIISQK
ncbi:MAG: NAD(P)-dependent oxidoreductase [Methylobacter tundripaludum]|nr:NAD(P)-dependent oxidoreductase [Methylobacter tundripaludum]